MNKRLTFNLVGNVLRVESALMLLPLIVALLTGGDDVQAFLLAILITLLVGTALSAIKPKRDSLRAREGFAVVSFSWILVSFFGGLPFYFSGYIPSMVDCFFETVSGFTTTGATILTNVEALPKGLLFWRSFTHWAGGMGVMVLSLAIIPKMGARSIHLMRAESPGPSVDKLVPRTSNNAKILYGIYIGLSLIMVAVLLICGMDLYDALINMFGSAGTGGFSNYSASIAHYDNPVFEMVIAIFITLFGVNFSLYYYMLQKNWRVVYKNSELRLYLVLIIGSTVLIALNILPMYGQKFTTALRYSFFQVTSVITTSGFATANFDLWPQFSRMILVGLMFVGASAGSTGGGIKVIRFQLMAKSMARDIRRTVHPKSVNTVKLDGHSVSEDVISGTQGFFFAYFLLMIIATLIISLDGFSFETNMTAAITCLSNVGPGLGAVGPAGSFAGYSHLSKMVLSLCMLVGRLEIFPILMLCMPSAWKQ